MMIKNFKIFENVGEKIIISEILSKLGIKSSISYLEEKLIGRNIDVNELDGGKPVSVLQNFFVDSVNLDGGTIRLNNKYSIYSGDVITIISSKRKRIKNLNNDPFEEEIWWEDVNENVEDAKDLYIYMEDVIDIYKDTSSIINYLKSIMMNKKITIEYYSKYYDGYRKHQDYLIDHESIRYKDIYEISNKNATEITICGDRILKNDRIIIHREKEKMRNPEIDPFDEEIW